MPDLSAFTEFFITASKALWAFMVSQWLISLVLVVRFLLPPLIRLFRKSIGR